MLDSTYVLAISVEKGIVFVKNQKQQQTKLPFVRLPFFNTLRIVCPFVLVYITLEILPFFLLIK